MSSCGVCTCLYVCPSVTFVDHVKTNKHIFKNFSASGRHTILVFPHHMSWQHSAGNLPFCAQKGLTSTVQMDRSAVSLYSFKLMHLTYLLATETLVEKMLLNVEATLIWFCQPLLATVRRAAVRQSLYMNATLTSNHDLLYGWKMIKTTSFILN